MVYDWVVRCRPRVFAVPDMNHARRDAGAISADTPRQWSVRAPHPSDSLIAPWPLSLRSGVLVLLAWTAVGCFQFLPGLLVGLQWPFVISKLIESWAWAILTPAIIIIDRRLTSSEKNIGYLILVYVPLSIPFTVVHTYLEALLEYPIHQIWWSPLRIIDYVMYYFMASWQVFWGVVGILQALKYYNSLLASRVQLERTEKTLIESRLNALRLQLEPHFLFNALNAISSDVTTNPKLAREMLENLGALLRSSLECKERTEITLAQELELLEHYLSIQQVRFGDRLEITTDIAPEALPMMVPSMLLQPLVENAIRHGIESRISGGEIIVSATLETDYLDIRVLDNGVGLPRNWRLDDTKGLGVRVTLERLTALYPKLGESCLTLHRRENGGTEVAVQIPLRGTESETIV